MPLAIKQGMEGTAFKSVAESVPQQALERKLHHLLVAVNHNIYLRCKEEDCHWTISVYILKLLHTIKIYIGTNLTAS